MDDGAKPGDEWDRFIKRAEATPVKDALRSMAGERGRCFYCSDGRAVEIDHYEPHTVRPTLAFVWRNLIWTCGDCNRRKSNRKVRDGTTVLLIDPTTTQPWNHFVLDSATGLIVPRVGPSGDVDGLAQRTLEFLPALNFESVTTGRAHYIERAQEVAGDVASGSTGSDRLHKLIKADDHGLLAWYSRYEGATEQPFADVKASDARRWRRFVAAVAAAN